MLEVILKNILSAIKPSEEDSLTRLHVINEFRAVVESVESLRGATVEPFGSFVSHLYSKWSDLDIAVEVPSASSSEKKKWKLGLLKDIRRALQRRGDAYNLQLIANARVPVLIYQRNFNHQNISCDISINNLPGQIKSKFLLWITWIDDRFHDMVLLVKEWAKAQNINDPKTGTLNSYSLCLLVIFHFQTCVPAILPPLMEIYAGKIIDDFTGERVTAERRIQDTCAANIERFSSQSLRRVNRSSLSELFVTFFEKFSIINSMASEYAICTYTGRWEQISNNSKWMGKSYPLIIEDPLEKPDNAARAVTMTQLIKISAAFEVTHRSLISVNHDKNSLIANLIRPHIRSKLIGRTSQENPSLRLGRDLGPQPATAAAVPSPSHNLFQRNPREVGPSFILSHNQLQRTPQEARPSIILPHNQFQRTPQEARPSIILPHNQFQRTPQEARPSSIAAQRTGQAANIRGRMMWKPRDVP